MKTYLSKNRLYGIVLSVSVPYTLFSFFTEISPHSGAAGFTSTLKDFGFNISMNTGLITLIAIGIVVFNGYEYVLIQYYLSKIEKDIKTKKLSTPEKVRKNIDDYKMSNALKMNLKSHYV